MSDARDAVDTARIKIKKAAAAMLVRKENLEAELERARASSSERVADIEEELAVAEADYAGALKELKELGDLAKNVEREELRSVVRGASASGRDPFERDAVDVALDNVRQSIGELEARVSLDADLERDRRAERDQERVDKEAAVKAELARLKAAKGGAVSAPEQADDDGGDEPTPPKKRTL